ncbi:hypothetical protein ABIC28_000438 [Rhodococcus sp. PvR044]|uniref:hypothetical protein n=1 Tax=Rhodococcus sp. PvR044 TaxID=3156402 RepID=UPI003398D7F0
MHRSRSITTPTSGFTITCEVESAYPERVALGAIDSLAGASRFIRERINCVARISNDPVVEVWTDEDGATVARFESGTHRIYRVTP